MSGRVDGMLVRYNSAVGGPGEAQAGRYAILAGDPLADRAQIFSLATRNLPDFTQDHYTKYYEASPLGQPTVQLAYDTETGSPVGMATLIPTAVHVNGTCLRGAIAADFAVDPEHRGFGPALLLQRSLISLARERDFHYVLGAPNASAEPLFRRLPYADLGRFTSFVKVISARFAVERYVSASRAARLAGALADPVVATLSREKLYRRPRNISTESPSSFDDRFVDLWKLAVEAHTVIGARTVDLSNWKCETTPGRDGTQRYTIFAISRSRQHVIGYVVYRLLGRVRHIVDLVVADTGRTLDALLSEFVIDARRQRAGAITFRHLGVQDGVERGLRSFGFVRRVEPLGLRVFVEERAGPPAKLLDRDNWYYLERDADL